MFAVPETSAFTDASDLEGLVTNGEVAGGRFAPMGDRTVAVEWALEAGI